MAQVTIAHHEPIKLDRIDRRILFHLSQDLRYPKNKLAAELKISPPLLHYRIERLNYPALGIKSYTLLIRQADETHIKKLIGNPRVYALNQLIGHYGYWIIAITNDIVSFCKEHLPDAVVDIHEITEYKPDNHNPLQFDFPPEHKRKPQQDAGLDRYDYRVLSELVNDPEQSNASISAKTGLDRATIAKRIDKLIQTGIIQKFRYTIDIFKYGFLLYVLKIVASPSSLSKVISTIHSDTYSGFIHRSTNVILNQYVPPSYKELFVFIEKLRKVDQTISIEVMQSSGHYYIEPLPGVVRDIINDQAQGRS